MEEFSLMGDTQWLYFSLELGVDKNVGRMILFHLNDSCILGFYGDFPKPSIKPKQPQTPHTWKACYSLGFARPLEFGAFEVILICESLLTALWAGAEVVPLCLHTREAHGIAAILRGVCLFPFQLTANMLVIEQLYLSGSWLLLSVFRKHLNNAFNNMP